MPDASAPLTPDAVSTHWSLRILPKVARPYGRLMRLERPIGWKLLLFPCLFASLLATISAADGQVQWWHLALFFIGSVVMRGAGCTLNDIMDRDIDAKVARTADRPIPSGEVSAKSAAIFLVALCLIGFVVLLQFNIPTILLGASSLVLVGIYPLMKRITNWPQLVLGLTFSWGALVGWTAQTGAVLDPSIAPALVLYVGCVIWTVGYDTVYALQDIEDDAIVGVGSSAQVVGDRAALFVGGCYGLTVALWGWAFWLAHADLALALLVPVAAHFVWQVKTLDPDDPQGCLKRFKSNEWIGWSVSAGLLVLALFPAINP